MGDTPVLSAADVFVAAVLVEVLVVPSVSESKMLRSHLVYTCHNSHLQGQNYY